MALLLHLHLMNYIMIRTEVGQHSKKHSVKTAPVVTMTTRHDEAHVSYL